LHCLRGFEGVLNSVAVRVAYTYAENGRQHCVFQQRKAAANATYADAWDIGAAGYIDPRKHTDLGKISPWLASAKELAEELNIPLEFLPNREHYQFYGVVKNCLSGQVDLLGECRGNYVPRLEKPGPKVSQLQSCILEPEAIAHFLKARPWWVPTAIVNVILVLEAAGFERSVIEREFRKAGLARILYLKPFRPSRDYVRTTSR
jgi:hypothetical protein